MRKFLCLAVSLMFLYACSPIEANESPSPSPSASPSSAPSVSPSAESPSQSPEPVVSAPGAGFTFDDAPPPEFVNASVHDPSVYRDGDTFYVIGSHLASAKTTDFIRWSQLSSSVSKGNRLIPDPQTELKEILEYAKTQTLWASDVHHMPNGKFYMYYCACVGDSPLGAIGLAVSDNPDGPYENRGLLIKSGTYPPDGGAYDANVHPNAVDPQAFFDKDGKFWMVYGSYSGGIFILEMNPETGGIADTEANRANFGYGKKLLGGNHSRIEGPYILYSPETDYYYMFLSFGGLDKTGGYNIRVCRSRNPDGPYEDAAGNEMGKCRGRSGTFFDDASIEPYGVKIIGGYQFKHEDGEPGRTTGYLSPGHNSACYDAESGKYFLIFHQRFTQGEGHEIRVHEMFLNDDGWFAVSPFRYDAGTVREFTAEELTGSYKVISFGHDINTTAKISVTVHIDGAAALSGKNTADIVIGGVSYNGVFLRCWDEGNQMWVQAFTALSESGEAIWGAGVALGK
ncbi:extracellular endo-alpha-(1-_5)-L-arabinanase 2 [Clostridia bacterium]|nr:extracellular endo-alpha-(1->5)-L-arabinanase 2 [Clostridia bacterium]